MKKISLASGISITATITRMNPTQIKVTTNKRKTDFK